MRNLIVSLIVLTASSASAQSKEDKKASLAGVTGIGIQETGVAALGGGTAGSPYLLQAENAFKAVGIKVVELEKANGNGWPIYNVHCSAVQSSSEPAEKLSVACEGRLLRHVFLEAGEKPKGVYAAVWNSPLLVANVPRDQVSLVEKMTQSFVDQLAKDWKDANPAAGGAGAKKKK